MADNKTDDRKWGERSCERGTEREWNQKEDERKQVGTLDQFQIPYRRKGQLMADVGPNVM